ncbi:MAG: TetR/AcrR family transcriptional regulator [Candidatus Dormibacteraeota bacterium]|nr:TetR/AcrR family transcriptional regulator [Candidatus Dormibacteraeota bacterium]
MGERPLRADAQRNREAILAAAEAEFQAYGADACIDGIAERAGVGVGTVYRNYATKDELMRAIMKAHVEPMLAAARASLEDADAGAAFLTFLHQIASESCSFKALADTLAGAGLDIDSAKQEMVGELMGLVREMFARGQAAGTLRRDVTAEDVSALMQGLSHTVNVCEDDRQVARCVDLICDALRTPQAARPA